MTKYKQVEYIKESQEDSLSGKHLKLALFCVSLLFLAISSQAKAASMVTASVDYLGGGVFQYNLTLDNSGGSVPISGLHILNGYSVFGLDGSSMVGAPAGWFVSEYPTPNLLDDLNYSTSPSSNPANIPVGGVLGGFYFQSLLDPAAIASNGFAVEAINAITSTQIPLPNAQIVPLPSSLILVGSGLLGLVAFGRKMRLTKIP